VCNIGGLRFWPTLSGGSRYGWTGRPPPLTKTGGWSWLYEAFCLRHGGDLSPLTFDPSFVWKWPKKLLASGGFAPRLSSGAVRLCPLTLLGALPPDCSRAPDWLGSNMFQGWKMNSSLQKYNILLSTKEDNNEDNCIDNACIRGPCGFYLGHIKNFM